MKRSKSKHIVNKALIERHKQTHVSCLDVAHPVDSNITSDSLTIMS